MWQKIDEWINQLNNGYMLQLTYDFNITKSFPATVGYNNNE